MEFSKPRDSPIIAMSYLGGNCVLYKVENTDAHVFVWGSNLEVSDLRLSVGLEDLFKHCSV